ncbi:MAG: type II secretion system protein [Candidatus Microsaccharimonas sp.]
MIQRGFTVVELVITITIMGILLTLAVVGLNATQVNARDSERKGDVEAISLHLETYYSSNYDETQFIGGRYLESGYISEADLKKFLPDLDLKNVRAPGVELNQPISLVAATNTVTTTAGILPKPSSTNDVYVYQPLTVNGALCVDPFISGECRRFNIYYYEEASDTIKMVTSKHQA